MVFLNFLCIRWWFVVDILLSKTLRDIFLNAILPFLCRQNAIHLEEKENKEKDLRNQIMEDGEVYKRAFHEKRLQNIDTNKLTNREGEKVTRINKCDKTGGWGSIEFGSKPVKSVSKHVFLCV